MAVATVVAALPLAAVLTVGSAAPLAPPLGACTGPDCPATWPSPPHNGDFAGRDASTNIFTGGDCTVNGRAAEAEGKIVTLGNLTVDKSQGGGAFNMGVVGVGSRVVPPDGSDFVTVGGNVDVKTSNRILIGGSDSKGQAFGNLRYAGVLSGTVNIDPTGRAIKDPDAAAPYQSVLARIERISACVGKATATGTVAVTAGEATFTGDGTSMKQVFNVTRNLGSAGRQIGLVFANIPSGATVVVNVLPDDAIINTYTGTGLPGDQATGMRSKLMWNFPHLHQRADPRQCAVPGLGHGGQRGRHHHHRPGRFQRAGLPGGQPDPDRHRRIRDPQLPVRREPPGLRRDAESVPDVPEPLSDVALSDGPVADQPDHASDQLASDESSPDESSPDFAASDQPSPDLADVAPDRPDLAGADQPDHAPDRSLADQSPADRQHVAQRRR
ncbi:hypothetical protein C2142_26955 [Streptomyces sp. CB01881]|nr:hypothetical protein C2142_26955 [Streptomyces sp. CB01881]